MEAHQRSAHLTLVLLFLLASLSSAAAQGSWTKTRVTSSATRDRLAPSIALDSLLTIHILFVEGAPAQQANVGNGATARYVNNAGGSFGTPATVDSAYLHYASALAIDGRNRLHALVTRGNGSNSMVCLRYNGGPAGGSFGTPSTLGACGDIFGGMGYPGIGVDATGRLHVVYENAGDNDIHYIRRDTSGAWSSSVDVSNNSVPDAAAAVAVGPDGGVHVIYYAGNYFSSQTRTLSYARDSAGVFTRPVALRTVPNVSGGFNSNLFGASIAVDHDGVVHVVYTEVFNTSPVTSALYYCRKDANGWSTPVAISDTGRYDRVSVAADGNGDLHVAAERMVGSDWDVVYLTDASGTWSSYVDLTANSADDGLNAGSTRFLAVRDSLIAISYFSFEWGTFAEIGLLTKTFHPVTRLKASRDTIDFGRVLTGACRDTSYVIRSMNMIGSDSLTVLPWRRLDRDSALFTPSAPATATTIPARDSIAGTLRFCPTDTGCFTARIVFRASNGFADTIVVKGCAIGPRLVVRPDTLDMGSWYVGLCRDTTVMIGNAGGDSLRLSAPSVTGTGALSFRPDPITASIRLRRLDSVTAHVHFCPADTGTATARIIYTSNGGADTIYLHGYGIGPRLRVTPDTIDMGPVLTGRCKDTTVTIANVGGDSLRIMSATSEGRDSLRFRASATSPALRLGALTQTTAHVSFCPLDSGSAIARIIYLSDGSGGGRDTLYLRGYGIGPRLALGVDTIDLGNIGIGLCGSDVTFTITDAGGDSLRAGVPVIVGAGARQFKLRAPLDSTRLGALATRNGAVTLCPQDTGCFTARLIARSTVNADTLILRGCALPPTVRFLPDTIDFGVVRAGACRDSATTLRNVGAGWLYAARPITAGGVPSWFIVRSPKDSIRLAPGNESRIDISFCPQDTGCVESRLLLQTNIGPREVILRGCGGAAITQITPDELDFGDVPSDSCVEKSFVIRNRGLYPLMVNDLALGTPFFRLVSPVPPSFQVQPGASVTVTIRFCPQDTGTMSDEVRPATDGIGAQPVVPLRGRGVRGIWELPGRIDFGDVPRGSCRDTLLPARNAGNAPITLTGAALLAPFGPRGFTLLAPTTERTVAPGDTVHVRIRFCPVDGAIAHDSLQINGSVPPLGAGLIGHGIDGALAVSTTLLDFGDVDTAGCARDSFRLRNVGATPVDLTAGGIASMATDAPSGTFTILSPVALPVTLPPNGSITVTIQFCPRSLGADSARWKGTGSLATSASVELRGRGIHRDVAALPDGLVFPCALVGESPALAVTVINNGTSSMILQSYSVTTGAPFLAPAARNITLAPGERRVDSVRFVPVAAPGAFTGTLTVLTSSGSRTIALAGEAGVRPAVVPADPAIEFGNVAAGDTALRCVVISNPSCRAIDVTGLVIDNGAFRVSSPSTPLRIEGHGRDTLCIDFVPAGEGSAVGTLRIDVLGGDGAAVALHGSGVQPGIVARPRAIDFGAVDRGGRSGVRMLAVVNLGTQAATLDAGWSLTGTDRTEFLVQPVGALPAAIEAGGSDTVWFTIRFAPASAGSKGADLHLPNSSTTEPVVTLSGRADSPAVTIAPVDLGTAPVGSQRTYDDALVVTNSGTRDLTLSGLGLAGGDSDRFGIIGFAPSLLKVGETMRLAITFTPTGARTFTTASSAIIDDGSAWAGVVTGTGIMRPEHVYWLDTATINVGERAALALHVDPPLVESDGVRSYRIDLHLDPRALFPFEVVPAGSSGGLRQDASGAVTIERSGLASPVTGEVLARLSLQGLITGQPVNTVEVLGVTTESLAGKIVANGVVLLNGCDVGRDLKLDRRIRISSIRPNPIGGRTTVTYRAPAGSAPTLHLTGVTGTEVLTHPLPAGTGADQEETLDLGAVASGVYVLELRDRAERVFLPVVVAK